MVEIYFHRSVGVKQGCVVLAYVRLRSVWPDAIFGVFRILFVRGAFHSRHFRIDSTFNQIQRRQQTLLLEACLKCQILVR